MPPLAEPRPYAKGTRGRCHIGELTAVYIDREPARAVLTVDGGIDIPYSHHR